jgi:hypothetical protein
MSAPTSAISPPFPSPKTRRRFCGTEVLLAGLVLVSTVPYVATLGFYSDDWAFLATFHYAQPQTVAGYFRAILADSSFRNRPGQALLLSLLYRLSGLDPLGSHLANAAIFATSIVLLYFVLRELGLPPLVARAIPLVYAFLPHYVTDRFWMAAFQANLSMAFCFLSFFAGLKALSGRGVRAWAWQLACIFGIVASLLCYEVTAGLFVALPFVLLWRARTLASGDRGVMTLAWRSWTRFHFTIFAVLLTLVIFKVLTRTHFLSHPHFPYHAAAITRHALWEMLDFNFLRYGLHLPRVLENVFGHGLGVAVFSLAAVLGVGMLAYLLLPERRVVSADWRCSLMLVAVGLAIWSLGYALFAQFYQSDFVTTGIDNRVANASALGTAFVAVGFASLVSSIVRRTQARRAFFSVMVTLLCLSGFAVISFLARYWIDASREQQHILVDIQHHVPKLPTGSTLLVAGVCPYMGPGIVFEAPWDLTGALRILYRDPSLQADLFSAKLQIGDRSLTTQIYADISEYPYAPNLFVYNYRTRILDVLPDEPRARQILQQRAYLPVCFGKEGTGASVF